jgi:hypothetical protein
MAQCHVGKAMIVSIDLEDFFTSIKQYQLNELFQHLGFGEKAARTLSELCTYDSFVPQGALTSPKLSNIMTALTFGPMVKEYCDRAGFTLTIYADDITISIDKETLERYEGDIAEDILRNVSQMVRTYSKLMGRLNWFSQLNPEAGDRLKSKLRKIDMDTQSSTPIVVGENVKAIMSLGSENTAVNQANTGETVSFF